MVIITAHLGAGNPALGKLVAPSLEFDCQKLESKGQRSVPQRDNPNCTCGDAKSDKHKPDAQAAQLSAHQRFEPLKQDF